MSTTAMPDWLRNQLIDKGVWNTDGCTRRARLRHHECGLLVLHGLDADQAAWPAICDPTWLTPLGEAQALITGRTTYNYRPTTRHLDGPRRAGAITSTPATNTGSTRVLTSHDCTTTIRFDHYPIPTTQARVGLPDQPPF